MNPIKAKGEAQQSRALFPMTAAGQEIRGQREWDRDTGGGGVRKPELLQEEEAFHSAMQH